MCIVVCLLVYYVCECFYIFADRCEFVSDDEKHDDDDETHVGVRDDEDDDTMALYDRSGTLLSFCTFEKASPSTRTIS